MNQSDIIQKKGLDKLNIALNKKEKILVMLAPSFIADFEYPKIIYQLRACGFDKITELTFGAKIVNKEYHKIIEKDKRFWISTVCPGIVETVKAKYPQYKKNLIPVVSPMVAMAKICRKFYPKHKIAFFAPCNFKKIEAETYKEIDFCIDYNEARSLLEEKLKGKKIKKTKQGFDRFYNDYTKIYPLAGGLSKTAHLENIIKPGEEKIIDGILKVEEFLEKPDKNIRFFDVNFCVGGCIGGPALKEKNLKVKKDKVLAYLHKAEKEKIAKGTKGIFKKAKGIDFSRKF